MTEPKTAVEFEAQAEELILKAYQYEGTFYKKLVAAALKDAYEQGMSDNITNYSYGKPLC